MCLGIPSVAPCGCGPHGNGDVGESVFRVAGPRKSAMPVEATGPTRNGPFLDCIDTYLARSGLRPAYGCYVLLGMTTIVVERAPGREARDDGSGYRDAATGRRGHVYDGASNI